MAKPTVKSKVIRAKKGQRVLNMLIKLDYPDKINKKKTDPSP